MIPEISDDLPVCEIFRDDPARPPLARRIKYAGMRFAGQLAKTRMGSCKPGGKNEFGILVYHRISPLVEGYPAPYYNVPPQLFFEQLAGLQKLGFHFLSLQEVLARRARNESLPPLSVVVTFDDGLLSVYEHALPTLVSLGIPATVFVNTAYLGQQQPFPCDAWGQAYANQVPSSTYLPLSVEQCSAMAGTGLVEIGAHTHTHADFRGRPDAFRRDMQTCLTCLKDWLGIDHPTFAFPFGCPRLGHAENSLVDEVRKLGLPTALTTEAKCVNLSDSPMHWGRFNAYDWDSAETLAAKLLGYYSWAPQVAQMTAQAWRNRPRLLRKSAAGC